MLIDGSPVILVNYYALNYQADQVKLLNDLTHVFDQLEITANTRVLWGGDFNTIFDISVDADGGSPQLYINRKNDFILIMTPEKQDKTLELTKHWSPDATPARNEVIMKKTYPVNQ